MFWFANPEADRAECRVGCDPAKQVAQLFKRIRLKFGEQRIHVEMVIKR